MQMQMQLAAMSRAKYYKNELGANGGIEMDKN